MACICEVCGKGEMAGSNVSHSNRHTKRSWKPNIQRVRAVIEGSTRGIRSLRETRRKTWYNTRSGGGRLK